MKREYKVNSFNAKPAKAKLKRFANKGSDF